MKLNKGINRPYLIECYFFGCYFCDSADKTAFNMADTVLWHTPIPE